MAVLSLYQTTIGKKVIMAVTGLVLVGYVVVHMLGNLHVYEGPEKINAYGVFLREVGGPAVPHEGLLWTVRLVLLLCVGLHIWAAYALTRLDLASRPIGYARRQNIQASYAGRTMRWGGVIILLFIVYHILHLTTGTVHPQFREGDIYGNLVNGFRNPLASAFYIAAMVALGLHLYHGVWSMFQTLGLNDRTRTRLFGSVATVIAAAVTVGNISIPLAVLTGVVR
jgi:succinate dehydrogenase / fumarate reductase cytochrome b subunit